LKSILCDSAEEAMRSSDKGVAVNYNQLPNILIDSIIPDHFNYPLSKQGTQRILDVSSVYSKGRGAKKKEWKDDSQKKDENASPFVRDAAAFFMKESYNGLEEFKM